MRDKVTMVRTKAWSWMRSGRKSVRMVKVLAIALALYWLVHFLSTALKITEALVSLGVYVLFIAWMKYQRALHLRLADMDAIDAMSDEQFKERMLLHFVDLGWNASMQTTEGLDTDMVITHPTGQKVVVQCLCLGANATVDKAAIQQVVAAVAYYGANGAMVITNQQLSKPASELARVNDVEVWQRPELAKRLAEQVDWQSSLWSQVRSMLAYTFSRSK